MLREKIKVIENLWEAHEKIYSLDNESIQLSCDFDIGALNLIYAECIKELIEKEAKIRRNQLAGLRASQQEIMLKKGSCSEELKDYLSALEQIGQLILEIF